jgi:hypothetical protein
MPAKTAKQARFMRAEIARKEAGEKTQTGMTLAQLMEFTKVKKGKRR